MFSIFSLDTWKEWDSTGKSDVLKQIKLYVSEDGEDAGISLPKRDKDLSLVLYEVVLAVVKGLLKRDQVQPLFTGMLSLHPEMGSLLVEAISVVEIEVAPPEVRNKSRDLLLGLIRILSLEKLYKERLEIDTLGDASIIKNKKTFLTKQIKVRTRMFYKQQKYNLLREESEGYAKLITELNQDITDTVTPASIIQVIRSLIGTFNLDPNRVLDLILEAFECRPEEKRFYSGLLHRFPHESATICEILGFKLNNYREMVRETDDDDVNPKGVFIVVALLLQSKIIKLTDIYEWLTPDDKSMADDFNKEMESAKTFASRANVISTKDKETDKDKDRDRDKKEKEDLEKDKASSELRLKTERNHKIQLAVALIEVGNWEHFIELSQRFPENCLVSCQPVASALCALINTLVEPYYRKMSKLPNRIRRKGVRGPKRYVSQSPVSNIEEFSSVILPMLSVLGPYVCNDVSLVYKTLRIAKSFLTMYVTKTRSNQPISPEETSFYFNFLTTLDECILPSLSMFDSNPCLAEEIWDTIKAYPYQYRYKLYASWKDETYLQHPTLIRNRTQLLKKAKYTMMRITKETIKPVSRSIGKQTHNFPGPVFEYILKQVQLYDNLISPVVDSFKYLTYLSYDVLGYCIVEIFTLSKDRTQNDVMAISPWFQSLSGFCGSLCKKYSMDLGGILEFVANQLKSENSIDLLILKDIVQKMGGTDSNENMTKEQLAAMCGWENLRREAGQYLQEKNTKRSSSRLKESLLENNVGIPLLILMGQQRSSIVYNQTESPHLKLVGKLYDQCQDTLIQFGSFLFQMITIDELSNRLPSIGELLATFNLNSDIAFFFSRPLFNHLLQNKYDELRKNLKIEKKQQLAPEDKKRIFGEAIADVFSPLISSVQPQYNAKIWEDLDTSLFLTFWLLTMSDLEVPTRIYDKEIEKLSDTPTSKLRKREIERIQSLKEKLEDEKKRQLEHVDRVNSWLVEMSESWFSQRSARSQNTVTTILQHCIFPRCKFSTLDAVYCASFVKLLHSLKTPNFSTLLCYDKMYCDVTYTVTSCTEQEAHHYARFLLNTLETVMYWHQSADNFDKECSKFPGFITRYRISTKETNDYVDYENYRHVVHKWHYKLTKAFVTCLESGDYIQIRNAILVLQGILPQFPAILNLCPVLEKRIEKVKKTEKGVRNDLFVLANSYSGRLKARKPYLVTENKFHLVVKKPETASQRPTTATTTTVKTESGSKSTKREANGEVNGTAEPDDVKKPPSKKPNTQSIKSEESETADDKKKDKDDKEAKRKREIKKEDKESDCASDAEDNSARANGSPASNKMEPPQNTSADKSAAARNTKRRRTDPESKSRKGDEKSSRSRESSVDSSPIDLKKDKKDKKRAQQVSPEPAKRTRKSSRN